LGEALPSLSPADWEALVQQSMAHGTAGLLCSHLLAVAESQLQEDMQAACRSYLDASEQAFNRGLQQLRQMLDALGSAGIDVLPIKGPCLALRAYPQPGLRRFQDLDLLIRPAQRESALQVLQALGYRSEVEDLPASRLREYHEYNGQDILFSPGHFPVEPHWALVPRTLSVDIDVDALFDRAVECNLSVLGRRRCLSPEDTIIFAALHGSKEEWSRLVWLSDLAALFAAWPALDARLTLQRASAFGCRRMLLLAVLLARDRVGANIPAPLMDAALADRAVAGLAAEVRRRLPVADGLTRSVFQLTWFRWRMRERLADRLRYAWRTLFTARVPHFRTVALPDTLAMFYPVVRIGHDAVALPIWKTWKRWKVRMMSARMGARGR
jgi:Uncharacterised nucleotidyltransferase